LFHVLETTFTPFIEMESTFGPTMKIIGCFFIGEGHVIVGYMFNFLIKKENCFMFCKQLLQPFSEMESTGAITI